MSENQLGYRFIELPRVDDPRGSLTYIEEESTVPFPIRRVYYLYNFTGKTRGEHAHKELEQVMVVPNGELSVTLDDGKHEETVQLNDPAEGLYIPPGLWRELTDATGETFCLVLASQQYDEGDYIRDYEEFVRWDDE